jgi:hypothetical protein
LSTSIASVREEGRGTEKRGKHSLEPKRIDVDSWYEHKRSHGHKKPLFDSSTVKDYVWNKDEEQIRIIEEKLRAENQDISFVFDDVEEPILIMLEDVKKKTLEERVKNLEELLASHLNDERRSIRRSNNCRSIAMD